MKQSRSLQASSLADRTPPTELRPVRVHAEHHVEAADVEPHCHAGLGQLLAITRFQEVAAQRGLAEKDTP